MRHDLAIVGGGIVGTSLAYLAAKTHPNWSVVLAEQGDIGCGASSASAGFDAVESAHNGLRELSIRSRLLYREMTRDVPEAYVQPVRTLWVVNNRQAASFPRRFVGTLGDFSQLHRADDAALPARWWRDKATCVFEGEGDGHANVGQLCRGIVRYLVASTSYFSCHEAAGVTAIHYDVGGFSLQLCDGRVWNSHRVALAAGAWLADGSLAAFLPSPMRVKKIASLRIDLCPDASSPAVVYGDHGAFFLPRVEFGDWLFSFTLDSWDCQPAPLMQLSREELKQGLRKLETLAPALSARVCGQEVSCDLYTPDQLPLQLPAGGHPNLRVLTGGSGAGYRTAPALAQDVLAAWSQ